MRLRLLLIALLLPLPLLAQSGSSGGVRSTGTIAANDCVKFVSKNVITSSGAACAAGGGSGTVTSVLGTANQIVSDGSTTTPTLSIANPFTFPGTVTNNLSIFGATTSAQLAGIISNETGTGLLVFATSPALTTPDLGTPSALTLTNATGLPVGGISGLGTGVATFLATPSSANLAAAVTDEFGTGSLMFGPATGTSGGIPYYNATTTLASSALLASGGLVLGGGAATAPLTSTQLTFSAPTLTVGLAGTSTGILALTGATSGSATITAPATAGTSTNAFVLSNVLSAPVGLTTAASYGITGHLNYGMYWDATQSSTAMLFNGNEIMYFGNALVGLGSGSSLSWTNNNLPAGTVDTNLSRGAAGVVDVGTGTAASTAGKLKASGYMSVGTKFTLSTNGCSATTTLGGGSVGSFLSGTTGTCTVTILMGDSATAPTGWHCTFEDHTTPANFLSQTGAADTTHCSMTGTTVSGDLISFSALGY